MHPSFGVETSERRVVDIWDQHSWWCHFKIICVVLRLTKANPYLSTKNGSAATTLSSAVFDHYGTGTGPLVSLGVKTERTAKKRRRSEQKWARYGLRKRVRAAVL